MKKKGLQKTISILSFPLIVLILFIVSCASTQAVREELDRTLNSLVNVLTYDQTIVSFGQPTSIVQGDKIFVATWSYEKRSEIVMPPTVFIPPAVGSPVIIPQGSRHPVIIPPSVGPPVIMSPGVVSPTSHGWLLQFTFDKATQKMIHWKYKEW